MRRTIDTPYFRRGDLVSWEEFDVDSFSSVPKIGILLRFYEDFQYETHAFEVLLTTGDVVYKVLPLDDLEVLSSV
ncbi:MAG: hypothetical protein EBR82_00085 [Caulobacteraceae bacterium]|nr:hypothetical protein [Caulobacteraceae bacterium]